jgi:hypothetical protein
VIASSTTAKFFEPLENRTMFSSASELVDGLVIAPTTTAGDLVERTANTRPRHRSGFGRTPTLELQTTSSQDTRVRPNSRTASVVRSGTRTVVGPPITTDTTGTTDVTGKTDTGTTGSGTTGSDTTGSGTTTGETTTGGNTTSGTGGITPSTGSTDTGVTPTAGGTTTERAPSDFRYVLKPGSGFSGATSTPAARGSGFGATAKAIADWDVVPFQTVSGELNVGVVAFHINAIERVDFSVNGGPWTSVREMQLNPDSNVVEYYSTIRADQFAGDGQVELRAIAYPTVGQPVVLNSIKLSTNYGGSLPALTKFVSTSGNDSTGTGSANAPYKTVAKAAAAIQSAAGKADNGTIYLMAGSYDASVGSVTTSTSWLNIKAAPGVAKTAVSITGVSSVTKLMHFDGVTLRTDVPRISGTNPTLAWFSNSDLRGSERADGIDFAGGVYNGSAWVPTSWATDVTFTASQNAFRNGLLIRNAVIQGIGSDALSDTQTSINVTVNNIDPSGITPSNPPHPDVYDAYARTSNIILYGISGTSGLASAQGIAMGSGARDIAIVNVTLDNRPGWGSVFSLGNASVSNILIKDSNFMGTSRWLTSSGSFSNVVVDNVAFTSSPGPMSGVTYR